MLSYREQASFEKWLQQCPLAASGLTYSLSRTGGNLCVQIEGMWQAEAGGALQEVSAASPPSLDEKLQVLEAAPVPKAPAALHLPEDDEEPALESMRAAQNALASMISSQGAGSPVGGSPPAGLMAQLAAANAAGSNAAGASSAAGATPPGGGAGGAALVALLQQRAAQMERNGGGADARSAEAVRSMLSGSLGTAFPAPPGKAFGTGTKAKQSPRGGSPK